MVDGIAYEKWPWLIFIQTPRYNWGQWTGGIFLWFNAYNHTLQEKEWISFLFSLTLLPFLKQKKTCVVYTNMQSEWARSSIIYPPKSQTNICEWSRRWLYTPAHWTYNYSTSVGWWMSGALKGIYYIVQILPTDWLCFVRPAIHFLLSCHLLN